MNGDKDLSGGVNLDQFGGNTTGNEGLDQATQQVNKVLIADDASIQRKYLLSLLQSAGIPEDRILVAEDAQQAIDIWEDNKANITSMILDNNMPASDNPDLKGVDVIEHIAQDTQNSGGKLPLMMLHSSQLEPGETMSRVDNAGAIGVPKGDLTAGHLTLISQGLGIGENAPSYEEPANE